MYVSPRRRISMQIHRDGRFAVKFQGLPPSRNPTLYLLLLHYHLLSPSSFVPPLPLPALTTTFSAGATSLPKLSVRSSQLLCWELTGQHPISNKACHRAAVASLRFTRASRRWRFPAHPRESPASSSRRNVFPIFADALPPVTSFVYRSRTAFFPSRNQPLLLPAFIY